MNDRIRANDPVTATVMSYKDALDIGAMALFGEKYEEKVRVLQIGDYSTELCGGTHLHGTGEIRLFKIISETAVAAGVRRLEALTGEGALAYLSKRDEILKEIEEEVKTTGLHTIEKVKNLSVKIKELERHHSILQDQEIASHAKEWRNLVREKNGVKILATTLSVNNDKTLRSYCDAMRDQLESGIIVLGGDLGGRAVILVSVSGDLTDRFCAHDIIQKLLPTIQGRGGGKRDFAQGGSSSVKNLSQAIKQAYEINLEQK